MTQELANKIFLGMLGCQLEEIYTTVDDAAFVRYEDAVYYTCVMMNADPENFVDTTISLWYNTNEPCPCCCGTGLVEGEFRDVFEPCLTCNGRGY